MLHAALERLNPTFCLVVQCPLNGFVETPRFKVGLNLGIDEVRVIAVKPQVQFVQLLRRERIDGAFNLLDSGYTHCFPVILAAADYQQNRGFSTIQILPYLKH
jgi:hypothetical protein